MFQKVAAVLLLLGLSHAVYSSGSLRYVLPFLSELGTSNMRVGEVAYDDESQSLVLKTENKLLTIGSSKQNFPRVESSFFIEDLGDEFYAIFHSYVYPGEIFLGGGLYVNSSAVECIFDERNVTVGLGGHDGSSISAALYLYLTADGANYNCIYSYNIDGPASPFNSRKWARVQTLTALSGMYPDTSFTTTNGETRVKNVASDNSMEINGWYPSPSPYVVLYGLVPSIEALYLDGLVCNAGATFGLKEKIKSYNINTNTSEDKLVETEIFCDSSRPEFVKSSAAYYYTKGGNEIHYYGTGNFDVKMRVYGWKEYYLDSTQI